MLDDYLRLIGMPTGAVRVSLGIATNLSDMQRFMEFANEFVDLTDVPVGPPSAETCLLGRPGARRRDLLDARAAAAGSLGPFAPEQHSRPPPARYSYPCEAGV